MEENIKQEQQPATDQPEQTEQPSVEKIIEQPQQEVEVKPEPVKEMTKLERIAMVCHEANRAYCKSIGDNSQKSWDDAEDWQKSSAEKGVLFCLNNPNAKPSDSHDSWRREKLDAGWKYGEVKDAEKKEHPCMTSYDLLPAEQRAKDLLFVTIVNALK